MAAGQATCFDCIHLLHEDDQATCFDCTHQLHEDDDVPKLLPGLCSHVIGVAICEC